MEQRRRLILVGTVAALLIGLGVGYAALGGRADQAPRFEVDPLWPEPLEYPYILGPVTGVAVTPDDHILVVHRADPGAFTPRTEIGAATMPRTGYCCAPATPVLEYDAGGRLVREWGGESEDYAWPARPHGIAVDPEGNVWVGGGVTRQGEVASHILKFSRDGRFLARIGTPDHAPDSRSTTSFGGPARFSFDARAGEVFVADGYANRRVAVLDIATGEVKRFWGAYGNEPDDAVVLGDYDPDAAPAQQFRSVTCAELSNDGLVYVCDRENNRIQVFRTDGTFVKEQFIMPRTRGLGSVWDIAFSPDRQQRYLYVADGMNLRVHVLDRQNLEVLTSFGTGGRQPSQFLAVGSIAVDSQGNIYTGEDEEGKRVQKFVYRGTGPVAMEYQGTVWPSW